MVFWIIFAAALLAIGFAVLAVMTGGLIQEEQTTAMNKSWFPPPQSNDKTKTRDG
jgi:hypothetical protein